MLANCANSSCAVSFRYLQEGRLFRLEADVTSASPANSSASGRPCKTEYFWLCSRCSKTVTLRLRQDGTVATVALPDYAHHHPEDFAIISRHEGKLLRSVTFARSRGKAESTKPPPGRAAGFGL
jgi:hypothetical protein